MVLKQIEELELTNEARAHALDARGTSVERSSRRSRRTFSKADKLRIVKLADACRASGDRGSIEALMRHEGIYSSQLSNWRTQIGSAAAPNRESRKLSHKDNLVHTEIPVAKVKRGRPANMSQAHRREGTVSQPGPGRESDVQVMPLLIVLKKDAHAALVALRIKAHQVMRRMLSDGEHQVR